MPEPAARPGRPPMPPAVRGVVVACAVLYVLALALDPRAAVRDWSPLGVLSPSTLALYRLGMTSGAVWGLGWWWTVLTATYLHGGILHILFNMLWMRDLGTAVERVWGPGRFFLILNAGGAAGFVASNVALGAPTIGASGAVFGLIGALIVLGHRRGALAFRKQMAQTAAVLFGISFLIPGVNNWGHAGGFVGGLMAATVLPLADVRPGGRVVLGAAAALALVTVGGVVASYVLTAAVL